MKKILSIIITVCLISSVCSTTALAVDKRKGDKNSFVVNPEGLLCNVYFYATDSEGVQLNGDFPGTEVYPIGVDCFGDYEYFVEYPENTASVIVSDGRGHQAEVIDVHNLLSDYLYVNGTMNDQGHYFVEDIIFVDMDSTDMGDVNGDNTVDVLDAVAIQKFAVETAAFNDVQKKAADFNYDGNVDVLDALAIRKAVVAE